MAFSGIFFYIIFVLYCNGTGVDLSVCVCQSVSLGCAGNCLPEERGVGETDGRVFSRLCLGAWVGVCLGNGDNSKRFIKLWQSLCWRGREAERAWLLVLVWFRLLVLIDILVVTLSSQK